VSIVQDVGWASGPIWMVAENLDITGVRTPNRPARIESLYGLHYPGPHSSTVVGQKIKHEQTQPCAQIWREVSVAKLTAAVHLPRYVLNLNPRRRRIITWPTSYSYSRPISVPRELWLQHAVPHYEHYGPASRAALPDESQIALGNSLQPLPYLSLHPLNTKILTSHYAKIISAVRVVSNSLWNTRRRFKDVHHFVVSNKISNVSIT
jgi:hypothetical protein